ncbi:potassium-transporting ATPase subunit KdpC [Serratia plymuthica]|uniref:Potassium-transporting ATPase KdpC subunit n=1 Tax=Serratia plymuthica S13 TaxID=1348660 RepID=S4YL17_SERPL|nr:potassium-transporting ATPase subunit KdpC [Serratia plymuthica]AGP43453.1 potassium-transporting ATPase subunit C [Serratia plymuthica S13]AHY06200.1 potassium-transporting ATPase subunit C [Serratia plymuthica]ANJ92329.1 potassium-transporting ATPase subunit C [Serratia plymuthica]ANJ97555.1 potassium-transporting ATPase subunit C [Serratia plymuthica]EKF65860.1 K+-transporting ATPase, C subunit [Serratia plymuthica A30]
MSYLRPSLVMLILLTLITGIAYPLLTTGLSQLLFSGAANGSLLYQGDKVVGSALIGQNFTKPEYFWGRPSATGDSAYNAMASAGSNLAATNPALDKAIAERAAQLRQANPAAKGPIPVDLLTASGSGLDPQISIAAAQYQLARVAAARQLPQEQIAKLIDESTDQATPNFMGESVVNVLKLNLALDALR